MDKNVKDLLTTGIFGIMHSIGDDTYSEFVVVDDLIVYKDVGHDRVSEFKFWEGIIEVDKLFSDCKCFRSIGSHYSTLIYDRSKKEE